MPRSNHKRKPPFLTQNTSWTATSSGPSAGETQEETFARIAQEAAARVKTGVVDGEGMAAPRRNRNGGVNQDADEESSLWAQIRRDIAKCSIVNKKYDEVTQRIVKMEAEMVLSTYGLSSLF